ncbi:PSP1-domain-containing protein [Cylindrobasidium torrendii FP15055 ss-10]|uniref:PSP1-domain-containing protein n=1 Tax=Cylindrobasidium torrendii FP15055 ss-10 TaxID=1314674 RepID=A0A0D7B5R2_9AGAR|nr:PSP1-domain-containing protein [Cylindrobasidium torrendii FP15055 ss-10]
MTPDDRSNRFHDDSEPGGGASYFRERAASQPPRGVGIASPPSSSVRQGPWSILNNPSANGARSLSFSARSTSEMHSPAQFSPFSGTIEDDETDDLFEADDGRRAEQFLPSSLSRGRSYAQDISRSRSHSLAVERPTPIGSPFTATQSRLASWNESGALLNSRYGAAGADGRHPGSYSMSRSPSGYASYNDASNMSPFMREVLIASSMPHDDSGGASGTTSRRHSVSVVNKPRTAIVGFNAPSGIQHAPGRGAGGGLMLSDEDLLDDFDALNLNPINNAILKGPSMPASMPTHYARSPPNSFRPMNFHASQTPEEERFHAPPPPPIQPPQQDQWPQEQWSPTSRTTHKNGATPTSPTQRSSSAWTAAFPLFIVEFKAGRTDLFYTTDSSLDIRVGDLVIVEADRGKDLGRVVNDSITADAVERHRASIGEKRELNPKVIFSKATRADIEALGAKTADEQRALDVCRMKVKGRKLPMEVVDAEYQWDRHKLTFYYVTEKRIDFRELVRELFRLYKTRIWMSSLAGAMPGEDIAGNA